MEEGRMMLHDIDVGEFKGKPTFELHPEEKTLGWIREILGALNRARDNLRIAALYCEEESVRGNLAGGTMKKDIVELWVKAAYASGQMATMMDILEKSEGKNV